MTEPYAEIVTSGPLFDRVERALERVRPQLAEDGGDVTLVEIEDEAIAIVKFSGSCAGCPMSEVSMRYGIESHLRAECPEILTVDVVSDKSLGGRKFSDVLERATFKPL